MISFWDKEATINGKLVSILPEDMLKATTNSMAEGGGRLSGVYLNYDKLLRLGIPGIKKEIESYMQKAEPESEPFFLYKGMLMALDLLIDVCIYYAKQAEAQSSVAANEERQDELLEMAEILRKLTMSKPETMREGLQLFWLYALVSGVANYGRMDIYAGDFLVQDMESGELDENQALKLLQSLWKLISDRNIRFNSRIIVGGKGRRNEKNADKFALLAMEATRTVIETEPQLTLRLYKGMNPSLMEKALGTLGEGRAYPMLYNDDVNLPAVANAFQVSEEEAKQYLPYGCGEYALDHFSFGSPNCSFNLLKTVELAMHNGIDPASGERIGLQTGKFKDFNTFDEFFDAYKKQVEYFADNLAKRHGLEYEIENESASFLFCSILMDDCVKKGKSLVNRGPKYSGAIFESMGMVNAGDSLAVIKELVYDKKLLTQEQMLSMLEADFEGYEKEYKMVKDSPKFGNDIESPDKMLQQVSNHASQYFRSLAKETGLDYTLIVNINNFGNVSFGEKIGATPDGRKAGTPMANGNTPTAGNDKNGITAFLNSLAKIDPAYHAGYVHNMKFTKQMFNRERDKLRALLDTYFQKGGTQAMITVVSRDDLENAVNEPEKYKNLIVRIGGYCSRFTNLSPEIQQDIINRTLY